MQQNRTKAVFGFILESSSFKEIAPLSLSSLSLSTVRPVKSVNNFLFLILIFEYLFLFVNLQMKFLSVHVWLDSRIPLSFA